MKAGPELENPFWRFSVAVYSAPGVSAECLALQEIVGVDVNLLLFCAWLGADRRVLLTRADIDAASAAVNDWYGRIVRPLRSVRRTLKAIAGKRALLSKVTAIELEAEQMEQAMLYALVGERWPQSCKDSPGRYVRRNIRECILCASGGDALRCDTYWPTRLVATAIEAGA